MNLDDMVVRVHPGDGLVGRFKGVALVMLTSSPAQDPIADQLLALAETASERSAVSGRRVARQIAGILTTAEPEDVPDFCLLAQADDGLVLILHGDIEADVTTAERTEHLSGRQVATWVDRIIQEPMARLVASSPAHPAGAPHRRSRLDGGVVNGAGLTVERAESPASGEVEVPPAPAEQAAPAVPPAPPVQPPPPTSAVAAAPPPPPPPAPATPPPPVMPPMPVAAPEPTGPPVHEHPPHAEPAADLTEVAASPPPPVVVEAIPEPPQSRAFESVPLLAAEPEEIRQPLPIVGQVSHPVLEEPIGPRVRGVICSRGHFNDPDAPFCAVCGISRDQKTLNLVQGPRPPLGVIVFDDGATYTLDLDYVLGREPELDPSVMSGAARPLAVNDPDRTVSRVHASVILDGWNVQAMDRGSANGTYLQPPGDQNWVLLAANQPTTIKPGTRVRLGQRVFLFDSHGGRR